MKRKQLGFSLIEVMLVMIIVVALSAGGIYGWQQWQQRQRLWITLQQVKNLMEQLRSDANWHNRDHLLSLTRDGNSWCLASRLVSDNPCRKGSRWQIVQPFSDVEIVDVTAGLGFYGQRNTAWPGHITLRSPAGEAMVILSAWGRIRICDTDGAKKCI